MITQSPVPSPQSPVPSPQSPVPSPQSPTFDHFLWMQWRSPMKPKL
ncbi:MAG: hypothetical protein ACKO2Z_36770 [Sphaerospermopsis kisseleviana]